MRHLKTLSVVIVTALLSTGPAFAASDEERAQAVVDTRQGLLKVIGYYMGPMVGMARQQMPYDADLMKANAEKIAQLAPMIPDVFRMDTSAYAIDTEALDDIWSDTEDFADKAANVAERARELAAATAEDTAAAMKAFGAMGASCKACHDDYRQQD